MRHDLPANTKHDICFYQKKFDDGRFEVSAFVALGAGDVTMMIAVWNFDGDEATTNEDLISLNGITFAYCTSDNQPEDFDGLIHVEDPSDLPPTYMWAIGALMREVL